MKRTDITQKAPEEAYKDLYRYFQHKYSYSEDLITWYRGFDISDISDKYRIAEAIITNGLVAQIRLLKEPPYKRSTDFEFGGF